MITTVQPHMTRRNGRDQKNGHDHWWPPTRRSNGSLVVGRGVPGGWIAPGQVIKLANVPTTDGHHLGLSITTHGNRVTLSLSGSHPAGPVLFQLPAFVANIAHASAGQVDEGSGTVTLARTARSVTVTLRHPAHA